MFAVLCTYLNEQVLPATRQTSGELARSLEGAPNMTQPTHRQPGVPDDEPMRLFMAKIAPQPDGCWLWTGSLFASGYGAHRASGRTVRAHRWGYAQMVRQLSADEHLDHTCHDGSSCRPPAVCQHRRCVNPLHLEVVSVGENNRRAMRDSCAKGHPFTAESTIIRTATGGRECRVCNRDRAIHNRARRLAEGGKR